MNKADLIQKIKQLEGITQDERSYLINLVNTKKKYGLVWEDKPEEVEEQLRTQLPVLREVVERRIIAQASPNPSEGGVPEASQRLKLSAKNLQTSLFKSENLDQGGLEAPSPRGGLEGAAPNHILIEGDNLHALTALSFTHEGKIDVIYIDPPYNTGNKDFKYNDSYVDKEDGYRHSKWLSFMDKRLRIAKRLLSDKGVIFISIDDNEQAQLKMLCDEVFYLENYLASFVWKRRASSAMANQLVSIDHEVVLCYRQNGFISFKGVGKEFKGYKNPDNDPRGDWTSGDLTVGMNKDLRPNQYYDLYDPISKNTFKANPNRVWAYIPSSMEKLIAKNRVLFPSDVANRPMMKRFKNELKDSVNPVSTLLNSIENIKIGLNSEGTRLLQDVIDSNIFVYPKPLSLVKFLISQFYTSACTVLDFFAGSGTTLHAIMQLNAEDGGNRQCILVTNNENNICEDVTYERNRRVIQGYTNSKGEDVSGLTNNNLRYYKSEFVGREPSLKNKREIVRMATDLLCIKENCYEEKTLDLDFISHPYRKNIRYFEEKDKRMVIVYDDSAIESAVELIKSIIAKNQVKENGIKVYVFSPGQYPFTEEFEEVLPSISLCALPDALYKAFMNVLPKKNRPIIPVLEEEAETPNESTN